MLDTDQLRSFLAIVDSGSFTKAAERVHKTQSAVSMHIRRLEEQLDCTLFVKQGRGARLTEEGERLIEFARRIVQVEAGAFAALSRKGLRGAARLGIPDDYAESFLADILARFNRRHPLVEVSVVCEASTDLAPQVAAGALDLALITDHEGLKGLELLRDPARARQHDLLLAARDRGSADHSGSWGHAGAGLLQKLQRDRHGLARGAGGHDPARLAGRSRPQAPWARRRTAGSALKPHGSHPRARTSE
jgi:DNA-binding transcriptional LysR family regulator